MILDNNIFTQNHIDGKKGNDNSQSYISLTTCVAPQVSNTYFERIAMSNAITLHECRSGKVDGLSVQHQNEGGNGNGVRVHNCKNIDISRIARKDDLAEGYKDIYEFGTYADCFVRVKTCNMMSYAGSPREIQTTQHIDKTNY